MKSTDFDSRRISQGYKNRPFLHRQVIEDFQNETGGRHFSLGLDIGCGAGLSTKALKLVCTKVIGTDLSPEMIRAAKESCGQDPDIEWIVGRAEDLSDLPIEEKSVDIATAAGAVQWIDRDLFLSGLRPMMQENGYLLIYDFAVSDKMTGNPAYTDWWHAQYLQEFPRPYRNESVWKDADAAPYGFHMLDQADLNLEYSFDLESFIGFMMIQSNVNARIQKGGIKESEAYQWFYQKLSPIFHGQDQSVIFRGYRWLLQ